ncbi:MAG: glycosyltransferase family 39 protein, partial [Usitatibacter sp.]
MRDSARGTVVFLTTALVLHGLLLWPHVSDTRFDFDAVHLYFPLASELLAEGLKFFSAERSLQAPPFSYIYPALLGATLPAVKHANFAISFVTLLLVFRIAWLAHSRVAAIAATLLFAASPLLRPFLAAPLTEPPFLLLCAAWMWALGEWFASGRRIFPVIAGIALGLAVLTRGTLFYLPVFLVGVFAWLSWRRSAEIQKAQARGALAAHLIALSFPLLFIAKNWLLFSFPFFATGAGNALYLGNN